MKVKKTYRLEQETIDELEKLWPARRHIEVRGAVAVENELTVKGFLAKMPD